MLLIPNRVWNYIESRHATEIAGLNREIARLQSELTAAYAHNRRVDRKALRLPDREAGDVKQAEAEAIPAEILALVRIYPKGTQAEVIQSIRAARQDQSTWEEIHNGIIASMPERLRERLEAIGAEEAGDAH